MASASTACQDRLLQCNTHFCDHAAAPLNDNMDTVQVCTQLVLQLFPAQTIMLTPPDHPECIDAINVNDLFCAKLQQAHHLCSFCVPDEPWQFTCIEQRNMRQNGQRIFLQLQLQHKPMHRNEHTMLGPSCRTSACSDAPNARCFFQAIQAHFAPADPVLQAQSIQIVAPIMECWEISGNKPSTLCSNAD